MVGASSAANNLELTAHSSTGTEVSAGTAHEVCTFRGEIGTISRHSLVFLVGTAFTTAAGYLFKIYVARKLGAEALGVYALGMTVVGLLGLVAALGLPGSASRFVAAYSATDRFDSLRGFLGRATLLLTLMAALSGVLAIAGSRWIAERIYHTPALRTYMPLFGVMLFISVLTAFGGQVLAGFKDVARRTVITNFVGTPLMMVLAVALLVSGSGLRGYISAQVISSGVTLLLLFWAVWKLTPASARTLRLCLPPLEAEIVGFSAAMFGVGILEFLLGQTDKILLGFFLDAKRLGVYAVATGLVTFVPIILSTVNQIFAPTIADLHARGERELLARLFQTLTKWILALTIPLAAVMIVFAPSLMRLFGTDFEAGWPILVIGTVGQLVNCGVGSVGYLLLMSGNQQRLVKVEAAMAVAMVLLNLALIPLLGLIGAALVASLVTVVTNVWCLMEVRHALAIWPYHRGYFGLAIPTVAVACVQAALRYSGHKDPSAFGIVAVIAGSYAVFLAGMLLLGLDSDDRIAVSAAWRRLSGMFGGIAEAPHDAIFT